ncbi:MULTISPECIES: hypothetical protein [unclassified Pseudomonas]|uniref:hypothetical protein n=1 Tax=Pseudomonas TaxID=286 RepID=UPI0024B358BF|nr:MULTISPECIES: hypothetical protein [unclassified Pseudomonas]
MTFWLTVLVGVLIAFAIGASIYMLIDSWISGSITTNNRGPRDTYALALHPRRFWVEFVSQCIGTVFILLIGVFGVWVYRKVQEPAQKPKAKRPRR